MERLRVNRLELYGDISKAVFTQSNSSRKNPLNEVLSKKEDCLDLLGGLQSGIIFLDSVGTDETEEIWPSFTAMGVELGDDDDLNVQQKALIFFSGTTTNSERTSILNKFERSLLPKLPKIGDHLRKYATSIINLLDIKGKAHDVEKDLVTNFFNIPSAQKSSETIVPWIMKLSELLVSRIHEGKKLDFWFLCGSLSEFEEHSGINLKQFSEQEGSLLRPRFLDSEVKNVSEEEEAIRIAEILASDHFSWFKYGRYALFWDIIREDLMPIGIVGIHGSDFNQIFIELLKDNKFLNIPSSIIFYSSGKEKKSYVFSHISEPYGSILQQQLLFKDGYWLVDVQEKRNQLTQFLEHVKEEEYKHETNKDSLDAEFERLVEICLTLSDDPDSGGALLLVGDITRSCG